MKVTDRQKGLNLLGDMQDFKRRLIKKGASNRKGGPLPNMYQFFTHDVQRKQTNPPSCRTPFYEKSHTSPLICFFLKS